MSKWEMVKLGDVGTIITGNTPSKKEPKFYSSNDIPFYKPNNISDEVVTSLNTSTEYVSENARRKIRLLPPNSLLVTCIGIIGKVGITTIEGTCNQQINAIIPNSNISDVRFLSYAILNKKSYMQSIANAPVVPIINKTEFSKIKIFLPPLNEQKHIAKNLDLASEIIKLYKNQLSELDKLIQSIFYEMFGDPVTNEKGWEVKKVKDISIGKLTYGSSASAVNYDGNTRYVRITDINGSGKLNNDVVSPSDYDIKYLLNDGDILFARSGATVGKAFKYSRKYGNCIYAGYLIRLVPNKKIVLPDYVFAYTKSTYYKNFIEKNMKTVAQPNINAQQYGDLNICIPPLRLQTQFAEIVTKIEEQKAQVQKALDEVQNLFNSLMQIYFE